MKQRLAPFLVLLEARYAPLLFAVAPQAYAVYLWLLPMPYDATGEVFAVLGGLGYEFIYVGAIAWAEEGRWSVWTWVTAVAALAFSMLVAYHVYESQVGWAWLHAGFPLVAFCYTMNMHNPQAAATVERLPLHDWMRRRRRLRALARLKVPESGTPATTPASLTLVLSKSQRVKRLAAEQNVSESTIWRKMKAGELSLTEP